MNFQEIVNKLEELKVSKEDFGYGNFNKEAIEALGEIKRVYQHGGEGEGDTYTTVNYFVNHDVYIRIDGSYESWEGTNFDYAEYYEVKPIEKTITVYE